MNVITLIDAVAVNQTSTAVRVVGSPREKFTVQFAIVSTITAALEGSLDGAKWFQLSSQAASIIINVDAVTYLRVVTSGAAGSPSATVKVGV